MGEVLSALDAVAARDVHGLPPREQLDGVTQLLVARNRLDAELARWVRAAEVTQAPEDDGKKSMRSWLRGHGRLTAAAAGQLVRNGRALDHLPALAAAFAAGAVTADQVAVVAPVAKADRRAAALDQGIDLAEVDRTLTAVAVEHDVQRLARVVHHYLARLDPDGPEPDPTDERSLTLSALSDGTVVMRGGETSLENSALLCERHHTKVHHGFAVVRNPGGRRRTFRPDCTEIVIGASGHLSYPAREASTCEGPPGRHPPW